MGLMSQKLRNSAKMEECTFLVVCTHCSVDFDRGYRISQKRAASPQFCSKECRRLHLDKVAQSQMLERFWQRVDKRGNDECWPWLGRHNELGYGVLDVSRRPHKASRISYQIHKGDPGGLLVCHECDNPTCVNPNHLWLGTHADNTDDAKAKGRLRGKVSLGEENGSSKLTESQVRLIRSSKETGPALSQRYGVCVSVIYDIRQRRAWKWVS